MKVFTVSENGVMTVRVEGEINTITTPELAKSVEDLKGVRRLIFDMDSVRYVSSAGLRLFLACQKTTSASGGEMLFRNCSELVAETFESVGYDRIMKLEIKTGKGKQDAGPEQ